MLRRGRVARSRPDLERPGLLPEPLRRGRRQQVRLAGRRAHPQQRTQPRRPELLVQTELLARHVVEAAEVDVVDARRERAAHHRKVESVVGAVDDDRAAVQAAGDRGRIGRVERLVARPAAHPAARTARPTPRGSRRRGGRSSRRLRRRRSSGAVSRLLQVREDLVCRSLTGLDGAVQVPLEVDGRVLAGEVAVPLSLALRAGELSCTARPSSMSTSPSSTERPARSRVWRGRSTGSKCPEAPGRAGGGTPWRGDEGVPKPKLEPIVPPV